MFSHLQVGDKVNRNMAGIPMLMTVKQIDDGVITMVGGWQFDVATGAEIDEDLCWGPKYGRTGSTLTR
jgi:hypothetical protein